ncbi:sporulation protein YtxC [Aquibacillus kalidii]|uniref:sporulation protein YtxC n=1 Tax=Aquibacillus kalidii TaxID=2762597 RepID=UPI0016449CC1|nr:sporulation protein YtxC [Aquibacillus kalidii]
MLEVYFENQKEAQTFHEQLLHYNKDLSISWKTNEKWGDKIVVHGGLRTEKQQLAIKKAMIDVFVYYREIQMIHHIIQNYYYYKNKEEIQRIAELSQSIISGEDEDLGQILKDKEPRSLLFELFEMDKKESITHFDSIVKFRLQAYQKELVDVVGLAIDEFKREEEHQSFIQSLREFVTRRQIKEQVVHVLQGTNFRFFREDGKAFTESEIKTLIQKEPLYIVGLDETEVNLTPLIAMAPKQIKIYGECPSEAKTLTVINVFQERVTFESMDKFPFLIPKSYV